MTSLSFDEALDVARDAALNCGASKEHALALARSIVTAEAEGNRAVGFAHLIDYLDALKAGRINGQAKPEIAQPTPIIQTIDAKGGMQHLGVNSALGGLADAAKTFGLAAIPSRNGYTIGALAYYPRVLAEKHGLVSLCFANAAPAVMPASGGNTPRFCTNPMAFAVSDEAGRSIVIDQSSTASAIVSIKQAADRGETIPETWALTKDGDLTTDPVEALQGLFLPFGGAKGANIALMVEVLSVAVTGADWSDESAPFNVGVQQPSLGYFLLAIDPTKMGGAGYQKRISELIDKLEGDGAFLPGLKKQENFRESKILGMTVDSKTWSKLQDYLSSN
jgi:(2R)-3-sulfolactate dehydrogenase (NADP+)